VAILSFFADVASASSNAPPLRTISINAPRGLLEVPLTRITIDDVQQFLRKGFPKVSVDINNLSADVQIVLPSIDPEQQGRPSAFALHRPYNYITYPDHAYEWDSSYSSGTTVLKLRTLSYQGVSCGLYGLLQEKLGFKFYHPKRTIIPSHNRWPAETVFHWKAMPRFDKKGFHIHTLHPIELTEQIHNPDYPNAIDDVKEYLNWLARNQQNVFQFYLLRGINHDHWIKHAAAFVAYAHQRGILTGVEFSLASIQQRAFAAIHLLGPMPPYRRQIDDTLAWLFEVKWDFVSVDFTMGEYLPDVGNLCPLLKEYIVNRITRVYKTKIFFTTHVIPGTSETVPIRTGYLESGEASPKCGILIHTVMCYSITEPFAPVYGNINQQHMLSRAIVENQRQETWYWPESAYWVAFDNSVPLLLLTYLDARLSDIKTMQKIGVDNHLTFSSGWEWGYWLVDWSIARWSWIQIEGDTEKSSDPLAMIRDLFPEPSIQRIFREALDLQNYYLKELRLMPLLSVLDPSAELPRPFDKPFQPRPPFSLRWLLKNASAAECDGILQGPVALLDEYAVRMHVLVAELKRLSKRDYPAQGAFTPERGVLLAELTRGLEITAIRSNHRALTVRAVIAKNLARSGRDDSSEMYLAEAASVREKAQAVVWLQESMYRYPTDLIGRRRKNFTSYQFGYLYPVSNLFFWYREEQQVRNERFDGFYMNIWDFGKLLSVESLLL
jgi:hypothetical protein